MATVLITGGTGLIGTALTNALVQKGYEVLVLTRSKNNKKSTEKISYAEWNVNKQLIDAKAIATADYIIHLAGTNVAGGRWTAKRKKEIVDSRVQSSTLLIKALKGGSNKVKAVVSASAIGWYGPDVQVPNAKPFVETDGAANDFLGTTCQQWEAAIAPVTQLGKRLVILRTGIVLSNKGGAYAEFKKPLQFGVASILGTGKQIVSWIHVDDLIRLYIEAMENESWQGVFNAVAPNPVNNKRLILEIAGQRNKFFMPVKVPAFVLTTILGEMSIEVLKSATVSSKKVQETGFQFLFPAIDTAVKKLRASK